jgi:probable F420-dependent oxidoreductase
MEFGVGYFPTYDSVGPGELARLVEQRGQDSLFFAEHTHIPAERTSPYGSGICLLIQSDPIITAKEVASIDHLSGGRFEFGVGAGWNREEMANHGTDPRTRMRRLQESVEAITAIWTEDEASYEGEFISFERIWCWPKPQQQPRPPVLVGGLGPTVLDRVLSFGDGWFPNYTEDVLARIPELRARADRPLSIDLMGVPADPKAIEAAIDSGARRALYWLPSAQLGVVEPALERWERAIAEVHGEA